MTKKRSRTVYVPLIAFALALALSFFTAGNAFGHYLGGKFSHTTGSLLTLQYTTNGSWQGNMGAGINAWNNTSAPIYLQSGNINNSEIDFYGNSYSGSWWGYAEHHPCVGGACSPYSYVNLYYNTRTLSGETNLVKNKVAAHELGHALGLAHVSYFAFYKSIMKQGALSYSTPQSHDVNDTDQLYP